ncbi:outer membrane protein assembly factor [Desulfuromonas versatilis]|uniref:Translocation and assembly module subunit TamA n=1 Tax=Desulfuromonas versatilis TaxID=2802975 RepID=A0ABM8HUB3_9BACT|nr:autotransporter assembly complex family protein [Desulfuromonas versatilis]BCR05567.1 outer membrane protein assembly factor [Desulfuromonas versatilis]
MVRRLYIIVSLWSLLILAALVLWPGMAGAQIPLLEDVPLLGAAEPVQVVVEGLEDDLLKNVQAALVVPSALVRDGVPDLRWLKRFERQVPQKVAAALAPFGYYDAEVTTRLEKTGDKRYLLEVEVTPGEPVRVTELHLDIEGAGANVKELRALVGRFPLERGAVLRHDLYEKGKGALKSRAIDLGYLDAEFSRHEVRVHRGERSAEIDLVLDTGAHFRFGDVLVHGAPDYPERFLLRYQAFKRGDDFSYARLGQTQLNFLDSDRFREVIVTPRKDLAEDREVPVDIKLVPSARRRLRPGVGYGTDTGPRVSLNYKDVNLFHLGHELKADLLIAQLRQSLVGSYTMPGYRNIESFTIFRVGYEHEDIDTFETESLFAEAERVRGFGKGRLGSVFLRLLQEKSSIGEEQNSSQMILPGVRFSRRRYNDPVRPSNGYFYSLESRGGHQVLGSDTGLLQFLVSGNALVSLPGRLSLITRVEAATSLQNEPLREFPVSLRFFAGGDQSVRGYSYKSLGPEDDNGDVVGGKNLAVGSIELERAIGESWGVAAFYDAGNAFNSFSSIKFFQGAGLGVRRYTAVGPIKVDLARQLGVADPSLKLHVSIGFGW